jgi:hypothetical protein
MPTAGNTNLPLGRALLIAAAVVLKRAGPALWML